MIYFKKKIPGKKMAVILCMICLPTYAMAWGMLGHRIIGEIASYHLSPKAKKNIRAILGTETIAMAANWADFIKSDPAYDHLNTWHYINLPQGMSDDSLSAYLQQDTSVNAYTKLIFLIEELRKKDLARDKKLFYLRLLIHIAGDLNQPMHTGRKEDLGGNTIKVFWFNQPSNLHRLWDEQLIEYQQLSYTEYTKAINHATKAEAAAWKRQPVSQWVIDSYRISGKLYDEIPQPDRKLGYRYNFDHVDTLNNQLLKGGIRLAGLLNDIFG